MLQQTLVEMTQQMPSMWFSFSCVALVLSALTRVKSFTFTSTTPAQCQNLSITWTGGKPPFKLLIIPPTYPMRSLSIPPSAYQGNSGSFSTPLLFNETRQLMLSMSDATGFSAGGISGLLTVGPPQGARICNTTDPGADFYFSLDSALEQCKPYPFTLYSGGAIQPITIVGFVPLDNSSFVLKPPKGDSYSWTANLAAGTSVIFSMIDSQNRNGGTSPIEVVRLTNDSSCINMSSGTIPTPKSKNNLNTSKGGSKIGTAIIGAAVGGFVIIGIVAFLLFFKKIRRTRSGYRSTQTEVDFSYDPVKSYIDPFILPEGYTSTPFVPQASPHNHKAPISPVLSAAPAQRANTAIPLTSLVGGVNVPPQFSNSNVPQEHQPRVVLHTDIEELLMELPPEYSDSRALIPGLWGSNDAGSSSASARSRVVVSAEAKGVL